MTRRLTVASMFVMAGIIAITLVRDAGALQVDVGSFHVRVVDAQEKGVPKIAVEVVAPDQPRRSYVTDQSGRVAIPGWAAIDGAVLSAMQGTSAMAWAQVGRSRTLRCRTGPRITPS